MSHPLDDRIREIGRRQRQMLLLRGAGIATSLGLVGALVTTLVDYGLRVQDAGVRWILSTVWLGGSGYAIWQWVRPHWLWQPSPVEVAQHIERSFPELRDQLSSAVSFLAQSENDPTAGSLALRRSVITRTTDSAQDLDLESATDRADAIFWLRSALAVLAVLLLSAVWHPGLVRLAAKRLLLPFLDAPWPRLHELEFVNLPSHVAKGSDVEFSVADGKGELPGEVFIQFQPFDNANPRRRVDARPMQRVGDLATFRLANVTQSLRCRAFGGDDQAMPWQDLHVVEPTRVTGVQLELLPPSYTGQAATRQALGPLRVLEGTQLQLTGIASDALRSVQVHVRAADGAHEMIRGQVTTEPKRSFRVPAEGERWTARSSGVYWLTIEDSNGVVGGGDDRWELQVHADQAPTVVLQEPEDNLIVTTRATVPLQLQIKDDLGLVDVELVFTRSDRPINSEQRLSLWSAGTVSGHPRDGDNSQGQPAPESSPTAPRAAGTKDGTKSLLISYQWQLAELGLPAGSVLGYHVEAIDGKPQTGQTSIQRLVVIDDEDYQDRFLRRQTLALSRLRELLEQQRRAREQANSLRGQLGETAASALSILNREVSRLGVSPGTFTKTEAHSQAASFPNPNPNPNPNPKSESGRSTSLKSHVDRAQSLNLAQHRILDDMAGEQGSVLDGLRRLQQSLSFSGLADSDVGKQLDATVRQVQRIHDPQLLAAQRITAALTTSLRLASEQSPGQPFETTPDQEARDAPLAAAAETAEQSTSTLQLMAEAEQLLVELDSVQATIIEALEELVQELSRWDSYQNFQRDLSQLREQQSKIMRETQEIGSRTLTQRFDALSSADRAALDNAARQQNELARRLDRMLEGMRQIVIGLKDPRATAAITESLNAAQEAAVSGVMRQAGQLIERNQIGRALHSQAAADAALADVQARLDPQQPNPARTLRQQSQAASAYLARFLPGLKERQGGVILETDRLAETLGVDKSLTITQKSAVQTLAEQQRQLATEIQGIEQQVTDPSALDLGLLAARDAMRFAADFLDRAELSEETSRHEQDAYDWLVRLEESLMPHAPAPRDDAASEPGSSDPGAAASGTRQEDLETRLVELRLLRQLQQDILAKTARFDSLRRQQGQWSLEQRQQLELLAVQQGRLADLLLPRTDSASSPTSNDLAPTTSMNRSATDPNSGRPTSGVLDEARNEAGSARSDSGGNRPGMPAAPPTANPLLDSLDRQLDRILQ